jgi:hypothetical protein
LHSHALAPNNNDKVVVENFFERIKYIFLSLLCRLFSDFFLSFASAVAAVVAAAESE